MVQLFIATDPPDRALPLLAPAHRSLTPDHLPRLDESQLDEPERSLDLAPPKPGWQISDRLNSVSQDSQSGQGAIARAFWLTKLAAEMIQAQQPQSGLAVLAEALQLIRTTHSFASPVPRLLTTIATQYITAGHSEPAVPLLDRVLRIVQTAEITPLLPPSRFARQSKALLPSGGLDSVSIAQMLAYATLAECYGAAGNFGKAIAVTHHLPPECSEWGVELLLHLSHNAAASCKLDAVKLLLDQAQQTILTFTSLIDRQNQVRWLLRLADRYTSLANPTAATQVLDAALTVLQTW